MSKIFHHLYIFFLFAIFSQCHIVAKEKNDKKSAIVIDFQNNQKILFSHNANEKRYPASLTKIMTVYILLNAIKAGKIKMQTNFKVSKLAFSQAPSRLGVQVGDKISVNNIIKALLVKSANDIAVVAAEGLCGSVQAFCKLMNMQARKIGMKNTHFQNSSGLPDKNQISTATDIAKLMISIYKRFPEHWQLFSLKTFKYQSTIHGTHCTILHWYKGTDGAKTGYVNASGFNLATTAVKHNKLGKAKRLFVVVMGQNSCKERDLYAASLMDKYFAEYTIGAKSKTQIILKHSSKQKQSLVNHLDKLDIKKPKNTTKTKVPDQNDIIETIVYDEEFNINDILAAQSIDKKYRDKLYEDEIVVYDEEYFA